MSTPHTLHNLPATESEPQGGRRFIRWLADGWRLFRRAPLRLFGLSVLVTGPWLICVGLVAFRDLAKPSRNVV